MFYINWFALLLSAIVSFGVGAIWYNEKLFGMSWKEVHGINPKPNSDGMMRMMTTGFIATLIYCFVLSIVLVKTENHTCMADGMKFGFLIGLGIAGMAIAIQYTFLNKPAKAFFIDAGYMIFISILTGGITGAFGA